MSEKYNINTNVFNKNEEWARLNRELFDKYNIYVLNIIGSPGSGKTTLIYELIMNLKEKINFGIIEGDVENDFDKIRIEKTGVWVELINTHGSCHLTAWDINKAINKLPLNKINIIIIENIGNLICPVNYNLGENEKIAILSLPEGDEKPLKYPALFTKASLCIITKIDLSSYLDFNLDLAQKNLHSLNTNIKIYPVSAITKYGMESLNKYLLSKIHTFT